MEHIIYFTLVATAREANKCFVIKPYSFAYPPTVHLLYGFLIETQKVYSIAQFYGNKMLS